MRRKETSLDESVAERQDEVVRNHRPGSRWQTRFKRRESLQPRAVLSFHDYNGITNITKLEFLDLIQKSREEEIGRASCRERV